jgi:hypothetical protein
VGAPLVDKLDLVDAGDPLKLPCSAPPHCVALEAIDTPMRSALPIALDDCPLPAPPDDGVCDPSAAQPSAADCAGRLNPVELPAQLACAQTRIAYTGDTPSVSLDAADWSHSNLAISASHALRIQLHAPALSNVFVSLEGPVLIQIDHTTALNDVRISGTASSAGAPSVELTEVTADAVTVGDSHQPFPGDLALRNVTLQDSGLAPETLELESVSLVAIRIATHALMASDVRFKKVQLDADSALISSFAAGGSRMRLCDATLVAGKITQSALADCASGGAIRLYKSEITGSTMDGVFLHDNSKWEDNVVGALAPSDITVFQTSVFETTFCDSLSRLALGAQSVVKCSHCVRAFAEPAELCSIPNAAGSATFTVNYCPLFTSGSPPLACEDPLPVRVRPLIDEPL